MYFKSFCKKFIALVLVVTLCLPVLSLINFTKVNAKVVTNAAYPFAKDTYALANAPTIKGQTAQSTDDSYQWYEQKFDASVDLTSATYLAVEYKNTAGNPGLTIGIMSNGSRFGTYTDGQPVYFVKEDGTITTLSVLYSSVNLGTESGMILLPISSLSKVGWDITSNTLNGCTSFFFETNAKYNWGFEMKIGEVGYYVGDPNNGGTFTKVLDLSTSVKNDKFYASCVEVSYPTNAVDTTKVAYPFKKGDYALANAPTIKGQTAQTASATYQWYEDILDASTDFTSMEYIAVEYRNVKGNPGLTIGVMSDSTRFGTYVDGKPIYFVSEDGTVTTLSVLYSAVNLGENASGMIVIPMSSLSIVGWATNQNAKLDKVTSVFFETNAQYNWAFEFKAGEIASVDGDILGGTYTKVLDLSTEIKTSKCYSSDVTVDFPAKATDTTKDPVNFEYPFTTGLNNAPKFVGQTTQSTGALYQYFEAIFDASTDLTTKEYIAFEYEPVQGNPGMTVGVISQGMRFGTYTDGKPVYFVKEDGTVTTLSVLYSSVNFGTEKGMVVIPLSSLSLVGWASNQEATLAGATSIWFETNAEYNWAWAYKVGEIGAYASDFQAGATLEKVLTLTSGMKKDKTYVSNVTVEYPASSEVDSIVGMKAAYPFHTGENAYNNSMAWVGPTAGDTEDNWQTFKFQFAETDLTNATYIAIHYNVKTGAPGITFGVEVGNTRYSIVGSSGEEICVMNENGEIARACYITYDAITIAGGTTGCLLIPVSYLNYQFGDTENTLAKATKLVLTTNSRYNYMYELLIGEVGYYTGQPCDDNFTYTRLGGIDYGTPEYYYTVTSDKKENRGTSYVYVTEKSVYGDTTIGFTATGKVDGSLIPWTGGAAGTQTMTTDSYGDAALELVCDGVREGADAYTAFTIFDGKKLDWTSCKGITLWARNDSDKEISFNLEIDVLSSYTTARGRFNITQGNRFWLYDVNTGEQTIYMTRPCVTLPVGFEGWIRIPFDAFDQAEWSKTDGNYGVFDRQYFMTEGSYVPYLGITIYSGDYTGCKFAVNKIGGYTTTPSFISAFIPATADRKSILELMGLDK